MTEFVLDSLSEMSWWESNSPARAPSYPETAEPLLTTLQSRKKRLSEEAEGYPHVVAKLNSGWRVILCRDEIQWILQRWTGGRWRSENYCRTREGLLSCIREKGSCDDVVADFLLRNLPTRLK